MQNTKNYGLRKPEARDFYDVEDFNANFDIIDENLKSVSESAMSIDSQTPTYTVASANADLISGEKMSVAFGKIAKAVSSLISHLSDAVRHVTSEERASWNAKVNASQLSDVSNALANKSDKITVQNLTTGTSTTLQKIQLSTTDLIAGSSALADGVIYIVYE